MFLCQFSLFSPLEQFLVFNFFNFTNLSGVKITNIILNFLIVSLIICFIFYPSVNKIYNITIKTFIANSLNNFVCGVFKENVSISTPYFFPYILFIFLVVFFSNFVGLIPFSFTVTSSIIFTFFLSIMSFVNILFIGFRVHGLKFFNIFLPKGAPIVIAPFLFVIEFISYNARVFSLAIRLFANMMSGHILLKIIAGAILSCALLYIPISLLFIIVPSAILLVITFLELCIAGLQAYVFATLLCIYFNESVNLH